MAMYLLAAGMPTLCMRTCPLLEASLRRQHQKAFARTLLACKTPFIVWPRRDSLNATPVVS